MSNTHGRYPLPIHGLFVLALIFVVLLGMQATSYLVNMFILSLFFALLGIPLHLCLRRRLPDVISVSLILGLYLVLILGVLLLVFYSMGLLVSDIGTYQAEFAIRMNELFGFLSNYGINLDKCTLSSLIDWNQISSVLVSLGAQTGAILADAFFVIVITGFMILEAPNVPGRLRRYLKISEEYVGTLEGMVKKVIEVMVVRTQTNIALGAVLSGYLWILGVDLAVLWGILCIVLSYIPYIGLIIAAVPAIFLAWLQYGLWGALVVAAGVCVINFAVENVFFPHLAAKAFQLPALVIILALVLWTWVLGPVGMFMAIPLTVMIFLVLQAHEETEWIPLVFGAGEEETEK